MTPQERQLVDDLFTRLASAENTPRDPAAAAIIADGQRRAPNALYTLVQAVLVQDEALKRAHDRIQQLEGGATDDQAPAGGFLDSMRDTLFGKAEPHGSVPNVQPSSAPASRPAWNTGQVLQQSAPPPRYDQGRYDQGPAGQPYGTPQPSAGGGGSFLGTAAAAAAGVVGGGLLMSSIRSMMGGGGHASSFGDSSAFGGTRSPWGGDQSSSSLARDAGVNDVGSRTSQPDQFDQAQADADQDQDQDQDDDDAMDMDSDSGDSDNV